MNMTDIVKLECCEVGFTARDKDEALMSLAKLLSKNSKLEDIQVEDIYRSLKQREEMGSTGFGKGIAIPHSQLEGLKDFIIGIAISVRGVNFNSLDKKRTKIFVTIIGPKGDRSGHLKLLAKVSLILKNPDVMERLLKSTTKIGLYEEFLRNTEEGVTAITEKSQDKLMFLVVKDEEIIQDITEVFIEFGIQESTIIETQQMENLLSKVPLFMGFFNFTGGKSPYSKIIMLRINKEYINAVIKSIEDIFGDLDTYTGLSIFVLDLFFYKG